MKIKSLFSCTCLFLSMTTTLTSCNFDLQKAGDWVKDAGENVASWAQDAGEAIANWGQGTFEYFASGDFGNDFMSFSEASWKNVSEWSESVGKHVGDFYSSCKDGVTTFFLKQGVSSLNLTKKKAKYIDASDYVGDPETMAIGVLTNYLKQGYHVFYASAFDEEGNETIGIGYTDYQNSICLEGLDLICSGFISLDEDNPIDFSDTLDDKTILIRNLETEEDDQESLYYFGYMMDSFESHFVGCKQYVQFGVTNNQVFYFKTDKPINDQLGGLYSYDDEIFIRGTENDYVITKQFLVEQGDLDTIEKQTNETMQKGVACKNSSILNFISEAKDVVINALRNLEEQTILGYNVQELILYLRGEDVKTNDILETTNTTLDIKSLNESSIPNASNSDMRTFVKWAVSVATVLLFINNLVIQVGGTAISTIYPVLKPLVAAWKFVSGAMLAIAFDILFENVIKKDGDLSGINWLKLLIVGIAGGISSFTGIVGDAFIGGITSAIFSLMDGSSILQGILSFIQAVVISFVISFTIQALLKPITALSSKIYTRIKINKLAKSLKDNLGDTVDDDEFRQMAATMVMKSNIDDAATNSLASKMDGLKKSYIKQLPADDNVNFSIKDSFGRTVKKADLLADDSIVAKIGIKSSAEDSVKNAWIKALGSADATLDVINGEIQMDKLSVASVKLIDGALSNSRNTNFRLFRQSLANQWIENPDSIPENIKKYLISKNVDLDYLDEHNILDIQNAFNLTIHEAKNGTMYLVDREIHSLLSHGGGIMFVKFLIANSSYFLSLVSFSAG